LKLEDLKNLVSNNKVDIEAIKNLTPGEVLLIKVDDTTKTSEIVAMKEVLEGILPDGRFLIMPKSIDLSILSLEE